MSVLRQPMQVPEVGVDFLLYLILVVVIVAALVGAVLLVQARRRKGGVIVDPSRPAGRGSKGSGS